MTSRDPILVTGANGFVGSWLVPDLLRDGATVVGVGATADGTPPATIRHFKRRDDGTGPRAEYTSSEGAWELRLQDLRHAEAVVELLAELRPRLVFHLAAQSSAGGSFDDPAGTLDVNLNGTLNLLEAVRAMPPEQRPRLVVAGSAEEYGPPRAATPLQEGSPLNPVSPYGVSKAAQTLLCRQYHRSWGLDIIPTRPFSHTGPGHGQAFVFPSFAARIAAMERGAMPPVLEVGDLDHRRDYLHVADVVRAYRLLADQGRAGQVVNICSGRGLRIQTGLDILLGASDAEIEVRRDPARLRPADVPWLIGDGTRLRSITGWRPERTVEEALLELLAWHREMDS